MLVLTGALSRAPHVRFHHGRDHRYERRLPDGLIFIESVHEYTKLLNST